MDMYNVEVEYIRVGCDRETAERVGASGTFQLEYVKLVTPFGEHDITRQVDQGRHYSSLIQVAIDIGLPDTDIVEE